MPKSRRPSDAEMDALVAEFRPLWHAGEVVIPWLRKHQTRFRDLLDEGWSWAALAEVLTRAGITYQTGRPWTADNLRYDVKRARRPLKRRGFGTRPPSPEHSETEAPGSDEVKVPLTAGPSFKPARLRTAKPQDLPVPGDVHARVPMDASPSVPAAPLPRFKPASLKPFETPHVPTPQEQQEREAMRKRIFE